jgi:hypothetical protein
VRKKLRRREEKRKEKKKQETEGKKEKQHHRPCKEFNTLRKFFKPFRSGISVGNVPCCAKGALGIEEMNWGFFLVGHCLREGVPSEEPLTIGYSSSSPRAHC